VTHNSYAAACMTENSHESHATQSGEMRATMNHRLLIIGCSRAKSDSREPLPAISRYDGPLFRVLRKYLRSDGANAKDLTIYVLSAEYGLIDEQCPILYYDQRMTLRRAAELRSASLVRLQGCFAVHSYHTLHLSLGRIYLSAIQGWKDLVPDVISVDIAAGSIGQRAAALKRWLWESQIAKTEPCRAEATGSFLKRNGNPARAGDALDG